MRAVLLANDQLRCPRRARASLQPRAPPVRCALPVCPTPLTLVPRASAQRVSRQQMGSGAVFQGFAEGEIAFRPTYKFDKRQPQLYDQSEKQRIPAYTDRVLWRPSPAHDWPPGAPVPLWRAAEDDDDGAAAAADGAAAAAPGGPTGSATTLTAAMRRAVAEASVRLLRYDSVPSFITSDHKPVVAEFAVRYQPHAAASSGGSGRLSARPIHGIRRQGTTGLTPRRPLSSSPGGGERPQSALCLVM